MTRIVVVYDKGAAGPVEIQSDLAPLGEVCFALPPSEHNTALAPLIESVGGTVVPIPADAADAAGRLRGWQPDAVLTFSDRCVRLTAGLTERLRLPGHTEDVALGLTDKAVQRDRLGRGGAAPIRHARLAGPADWPGAVEAVRLPAVLKPRRGEGSADTYLITDEADGERRVADLTSAGPGGLILEEYLAGVDRGRFGDYVSVETVVTNGGPVHLMVTGKLPLLPPFREHGFVWPALLDPAETARILALADAAVAALEVRTGVLHTEVKLTAAGPRIIEVNGRLGGYLTDMSRHATGRSLIRLAGEIALGTAVDQRLGDAWRLESAFISHFTPAPRRACRLVKATGAAEVRRLDGVLAYRRLIQPGSEIADLVTTQGLDLLIGRAPNHADLLDLLDRAQRELTFEFSAGGETFTARGDELG